MNPEKEHHEAHQPADTVDDGGSPPRPRGSGDLPGESQLGARPAPQAEADLLAEFYAEPHADFDAYAHAHPDADRDERVAFADADQLYTFAQQLVTFADAFRNFTVAYGELTDAYGKLAVTLTHAFDQLADTVAESVRHAESGTVEHSDDSEQPSDNPAADGN